MKNNYESKLKKCTELLITNDSKTISSLMLASKKPSIISMVLLPYLALFLKEAQEHFSTRVIDKEFDEQLDDLRNSIKLLSEKYNKTETKFLEIDFQQDQHFKDLLTFDFTKELNIHYNLGVYFDNNGNVVGDTQLLNLYLYSAFKDGKIQKDTTYKLGVSFGKSLSLIRMKTHQKKTASIKELESIKLGYIDFNTNVMDSVFVYNLNKGLNLFILHMLSMIGMSKYIIQRMLATNNTWRLRCEYITAHNIWSGLRIISEHFKQNSYEGIDVSLFNDLVEKGRNFFPSAFRNAMFHYELIKGNDYCIKEENYRSDILLFGLVETVFDGKTAQDYYAELREYLDEVERCLKVWFNFDQSAINWDL